MLLQRSDAVPDQLFRKIKGTVENDSFPWFYASTSAYDGNKDLETLYNGSFGHIAYNNGKLSPISDYLEAALLVSLDKFSMRVQTLKRIRIGCIPVSAVPTINPPHVDIGTPHKVALLYLNDSDGDTILYNEHYNCGTHFSSSDYYQYTLGGKTTVETTITPEENKMIVFDGLQYHSSSAPLKTKRRIAVNYVFT